MKVLKTLPAVALALMIAASPVLASDFLSSRKFYSLISVGVGAYCLKEASDARSDANDAYALYEAAGTTASAREFYDESRQQDTKAAIMLGLGAGTLLYGVHLWFSGDDSLPDAKMDRGLVEVKGVNVDVGGDPVTKRLGLRLRRGF